MIFYISDLHLGHKNIIKLCNRPFETIEDMDDTIINNWNNVVKNGDTVYIVGDFACKTDDIEKYLERLKGNKILIIGNHDSKIVNDLSLHKYFANIVPYLEIHSNMKNITLFHYPMLEWKSSRKVDLNKLGYLIFGHIHNSIKTEYEYLTSLPNALNAGVDINNFTPVTFEQLVENNNCFYNKKRLDKNK